MYNKLVSKPIWMLFCFCDQDSCKTSFTSKINKFN